LRVCQITVCKPTATRTNQERNRRKNPCTIIVVPIFWPRVGLEIAAAALIEKVSKRNWKSKHEKAFKKTCTKERMQQIRYAMQQKAWKEKM